MSVRPLCESCRITRSSYNHESADTEGTSVHCLQVNLMDAATPCLFFNNLFGRVSGRLYPD